MATNAVQQISSNGLISRLRNLWHNREEIKKFLGWKRNDVDAEWTEKAIKAIVKKLKRSGVNELHRALANPGQPSKCITMKQSHDGCLKVSNRSAYPHLIACHIWRWSDLNTHHELKPLATCEFPWTLNRTKVCINPFHYERLERPTLPAVRVPRYLQFSSDSSMDVTISTDDYPVTAHQSKPDNDTSMTDVREVNYQETIIWATIAYYELCTRVGESFYCKSNSVIVDGYTDPTNCVDRFCLGQLGNVHRNKIIEQTRRHIGKGMHLYYVGGEVYFECFSDSPIFVQSRMWNHLNQCHPSTVCKILPGSSFKLFDTQTFARLLCERVRFGYEAVYELTKMCIIQLSFVKGWGNEYHRQDITSTPCWLEVHLNAPLKWIDSVVSKMDVPQHTMTSMS